MLYREFNKFPLEARKRQLVAAFQQGLTAERMPKAMQDALDDHTKRVEALEITLKIFSDFPPKRRTIQRLKERLEQEKLWVEHYEACEAEHKRGRERLSEFVKRADFKVVVETIVHKEYKEEPKDKKPEKKKDNPVQMVAKLLQPGETPPRRGAARRRFFMARRAN